MGQKASTPQSDPAAEAAAGDAADAKYAATKAGNPQADIGYWLREAAEAAAEKLGVTFEPLTDEAHDSDAEKTRKAALREAAAFYAVVAANSAGDSAAAKAAATTTPGGIAARGIDAGAQ